MTREHDRVPFAVEVEFRTAGAFLVAYSTNLSTGGMFLETPDPLPVGTPITLHFTVHGFGPFQTTASVAWTRHPSTDDKPPGMGIRFSQPFDEQHGEAIDKIVAAFRGLRLVVIATSAHARALLTRALRSMLSAADIVELPDSSAAEVALEKDADLAVLDLDEDEADGIVAIRLAKVGRERPIPVIVLAALEETRRRARELGADEVLTNPPSQADLTAAVMRTLGRPSRVG